MCVCVCVWEGGRGEGIKGQHGFVLCDNDYSHSITKLEETNILIMKVKLIYFAISLIVF